MQISGEAKRVTARIDELLQRKEFTEERSARPRRIWSEDGLVEDKQQEKRSEKPARDRGGPTRGDDRPRGGRRS